jgi:hypothetical protein
MTYFGGDRVPVRFPHAVLADRSEHVDRSFSAGQNCTRASRAEPTATLLVGLCSSTENLCGSAKCAEDGDDGIEAATSVMRPSSQFRHYDVLTLDDPVAQVLPKIAKKQRIRRYELRLPPEGGPDPGELQRPQASQ